ncbi:MAG: hypothetical protein ACJAVS_002462 [Paracoccaceae bacterium]|jgi:hypothetical protein
MAGANAARGRLDACFDQSFGAVDGPILRSTLRMTDRPRPVDRAACMGVDDERDMTGPLSGGGAGELRHPQQVRRRRPSPAVRLVQRVWPLVARGRGLVRFAANGPLNRHGALQSGDRQDGVGGLTRSSAGRQPMAPPLDGRR